jgi:ubiquitin C-terminal hydrolase
MRSVQRFKSSVTGVKIQQKQRGWSTFQIGKKQSFTKTGRIANLPKKNLQIKLSHFTGDKRLRMEYASINHTNNLLVPQSYYRNGIGYPQTLSIINHKTGSLSVILQTGFLSPPSSSVDRKNH